MEFTATLGHHDSDLHLCVEMETRDGREFTRQVDAVLKIANDPVFSIRTAGTHVRQFALGTVVTLECQPSCIGVALLPMNVKGCTGAQNAALHGPEPCQLNTSTVISQNYFQGGAQAAAGQS